LSVSLNLNLFLIVFARMAGIFLIAPVFGSRYLPAQLKIGFALVTTAVLTPVVASRVGQVPDPWSAPVRYAVTLVSETGIGLVLGYATLLILMTVQVAGQFIDLQMGFGIVNVVDPLSDAPVPLVGNFKYLLAILVFLAVNGHHFLLEALVASYDLVALGQAVYGGLLVSRITDLFSSMFLVAVKLALPVVGTLFLTDVALGIIARTVPQMNILVLGLSVKIIVGIVVLLLLLPAYVFLLGGLFDRLYPTLWELLHLAGGG